MKVCLKSNKRTAESINKVGLKKSLVDHEGWTSEYQGQKKSLVMKVGQRRDDKRRA